MRYRLTINFCIVEWHILDKKQILSFQQSTAPNTAQATPAYGGRGLATRYKLF